MTSSKRWHEIDRVFAAALERPPARRRAYVSQACGDDDALLDAVKGLLRAHDQTGDLLDAPIDDVAAGLFCTAESALDVGQIVGAYEILGEIGRGGMGVVYACRDTKLDRRAALKMLPRGFGDDDHANARLLAEAKAAARLDHVNVATIYEFGETDAAQLYIAMAYYEGKTLRERLGEGLPTRAEAVDVALQMGRGLAKAHRCGVVHRDVKPENAVITEEGVVKLLDFGLAKLPDQHLAQRGAVMGTIAYMSPEQARGEEVDGRSDIWSLGVVLYEMLCGERPFQAVDLPGLLQAIQTGEPAPPSTLSPGVDALLSDIVERMLAKSRDARFSTMDLVLEALDGARTDRPTAGSLRQTHRLGATPGEFLRRGSDAFAETATALERDARASRPPAVDLSPRPLSTFAGRDDELAALEACFEKTREGSGSLTSVEGSAGLGKSRLLHEFCGRIPGDTAEILRGSCHVRGAGVAFLPFIQCLEQLLELSPPGTTGPSSTEALERDVVARIERIDPRLEEFFALYLDLLAIPSRRWPLAEHLDGEPLHVAMIEALCACLTLAARKQPLIVLLEDWHWADEASRAMLSRLAELAPAHRLMVVVSFRPEGFTPAFGPAAEPCSIRLSALDSSATLHVMKSVVDVDHFPEDFARRIHRRTDGNPFFVEEVCQALVEQGVLGIDGDRACVAGSVEDVELPATVQAVIRARLDRLDHRTRQIVCVAAVLGRDFSQHLLLRMLPERADLVCALDRLRALALIRQTSVFPEATYRFKHVLTREVAYDSLLPGERRRWHERAGVSLEADGGARSGDRQVELAHHFGRANRWEKAARYGTQAARRAMQLNQFGQAMRLLEEVRWSVDHLAPGQARRDALVAVLLDQETVCETLGRRARQQQMLDELLALLDPERDRERLAETYRRLGDLQTLLRRFADAERSLDEAHRLAADVPGAVAHSIFRSLGLLKWHQHETDEALAWTERALASSKDNRSVASIGEDLVNLGSIHRERGDLDRARACFCEALELGESRDEPLTISTALYKLGLLHLAAGELDDAIAWLERGVEVSQERRVLVGLSYHLTSLAKAHMERGDVDQGLAYYRRAVDTARRVNDTNGLGQALEFLGQVTAGLGEYVEAAAHFGEAAEIFGRLERPADQLKMLEQRAQALRVGARGSNDALEAYRQALAITRDTDDRAARGRILNTLGIMAWERGDHRCALDHYHEALELYGALDDPTHQGLILNSLGVTLDKLGRLDDAKERLEQAVRHNRDGGARLLEAHALAALAGVCYQRRDVARAEALYEESLAIRRQLGDASGEGWMLYHLAKIARARGSLLEASDLGNRAGDIARDQRDHELLGACRSLRPSGVS